MSEKNATTDQKSRQIPYSDFELHSVKYTPKNGVTVKYINGETGRHENPSDDKNVPHPNFIKALKALSEHVVDILGLQEGYDYAREQLKSNEEALKGAVKGAKDTDAKFTVSGVNFYYGKNKSVKINGSLKCKTGATGLSTPAIYFDNTAMGIEQTIEGLCETIKKETYNFVILQKKDAEQTEMKFGATNDPDVDQPISKKKGKGKQTDIVTQAKEAEESKGTSEEEKPSEGGARII